LSVVVVESGCSLNAEQTKPDHCFKILRELVGRLILPSRSIQIVFKSCYL